jgi:hypothetical protein
VLAVLGICVWLMLKYDVLALARAFVGPAWRALEVSARAIAGPLWQGLTVLARPIVQRYLIRRVESPLWSVLTKGALVLVGARFVSLVYEELRSGSTIARRAIAWWRAQHRAVRWSIVSALIFGGGFLGFGLYILPFWLPLSGKALQSLNFAGLDRFLNRVVGPAQRRFRRLMRTNPFWRIVRRPYRLLMYFLLVGVRKLARVLRHWFAAAWRHRPARPAVGANLADASPRQ